jgi:hypothetical protein
MLRRKPRISSQYWITVTSNCLDISILEWCKLFADRKDPHHWQNIVSDRDFERLIYRRMRVTRAHFEAYRLAVRRYRDKFLAHLDSDLAMEIPNLDLAMSASSIYYAYVRDVECTPATARSFPADLHDYYVNSMNEAQKVFLMNIDVAARSAALAIPESDKRA